MLVLDVLGVLVAIVLVIALPGWLLARALFPRVDSLRPSERFFLATAGGILVTMTVGILLGFLPHGEGRGFLQSIPTRGMPYVEVAMIAVCAGLFAVGLRRGAYPGFAKRYPRFARRVVAPSAPGAQPQPALQGGDQKP